MDVVNARKSDSPRGPVVGSPNYDQEKSEELMHMFLDDSSSNVHYIFTADKELVDKLRGEGSIN